MYAQVTSDVYVTQIVISSLTTSDVYVTQIVISYPGNKLCICHSNSDIVPGNK